MLPPMLPLSAVPITSQHDPVRQRPDIRARGAGAGKLQRKHHRPEKSRS